MLVLPDLEMSRGPFVHGTSSQFFPDALYKELVESFPHCPANQSPTGHSVFPDDPAFTELMTRNEAWRAVHEAFHGQSFISWCAKQFGQTFVANGFKINIDDAHYVDFVESRAEKVHRDIPVPPHQPNDLWVRFDIAQAEVGYRNPPHVDHRRRALTLLIYFCDADELKMDGGELQLYRRRAGFLKPEVSLRPRHNFAVAFPNVPASIHAVPEIRNSLGRRNHVQVQLSGFEDLWPVDWAGDHSRSKVGSVLWRAVRGMAS